MGEVPRPTLKPLSIDFFGQTPWGLVLLGIARRLLRTWRRSKPSAARGIETLDNGNQLVKLRRHSPLGIRGTILELPRDQVIFRAVARGGEWDFELSKYSNVFFSPQAKRILGSSEPTKIHD